jgi:hypothetical protein
MRWTGYVTLIGEKRNAYWSSVGKSQRKRLVGRPRHRWVDNIKMHLVEKERDGVDWIGLARDRDKWRAAVNAAMNLRIL